MGRANQHDITKASDDQPGAAEDERSHEDVAQLRIRLDQPKQLLSIELNHLAMRDRPNPRQGSATGQHRALTGKLRGALTDDQHVHPGGRSSHLDLSAQYDEERHRLLSYI